MGGGSGWTPKDWGTFTTTTAGKTVDEIFTSRSMPAGMDPKKIQVRESRDSADNPESSLIILALDVTGSMDPVLEELIKNGVNTVVQETIKRKPYKNPHF